MDTYDTYFDEPFNHGTPFRRAHEEGLLTGGVHIGIRGATYGPQTFAEDEAMGFQTLDARAVAERGAGAIAAATRDAIGDGPVYLSVDIDVLDPAFAPATGTPEPGGLATREVLWILHDLVGLPLVAADLVEVSPPYDAGGVTGLAASQIAYEVLSLFARRDG
jgi:agmatinase